MASDLDPSKMLRNRLSSAVTSINEERMMRQYAANAVPKHFKEKTVFASPPPPPPPSPIFRQTFNLMTGKLEWQPKPIDYDYHQEIARSGYADMLHDVDRNILYQEAIRQAVKRLVNDPNKNPNGDRQFHCLDIGTGSGLLSMMVVQAFKDENYNNFKVTACECFQPMGECARKVIARNNMDDKITVVLKRSTDLVFDEDLNSTKVDLLVAELLDTELIGEGCLHIYRQALENFCRPDCIVIPQKARIYIQLVQSAWLYDRHQLKSPMRYCSIRELSKTDSQNMDDVHYRDISLPKDIVNCSGIHSLYDVQLSELSQDCEFARVCDARVAFEFDFSNLDTLKLFETKGLELTIEQDVVEPMMVFMWWDLTMISNDNSYNGKEILLSCAPTWALLEKPLNEGIFTEAPVWRDHWMGAIYYFSSTITLENTINQLKIDDKITIYCNHDDYSLWFDLRPHVSPVKKPITCSCGLHSRLSRHRISMMNDNNRLSLFAEAIEDRISGLADKDDIKILYIGHISYLLLVLARYPQVGHLLFYDNSTDASYAHDFYKRLLRENQCPASIKMVKDLKKSELVSLIGNDDDSPNQTSISLSDNEVDTSQLSDVVDLIVTEPYFQIVGLPWDVLHYWTLLQNLEESGIGTRDKLLVTNATIKSVLVKFDNLGRIRSPVEICQGFDLRDFDSMINSSIDYADQSIEPQPLWEYPGIALQAQPTSLFDFDFNLPIKTYTNDENDGNLTLVKRYTCDKDMADLSNTKLQGLAVVFWLDYNLFINDAMRSASGASNQTRTITTGPTSEIRAGQKIEWHKDWKQGVFFLSGLNPISDDASQNAINLRVDFNIRSGEMNVTQLTGSVVF